MKYDWERGMNAAEIWRDVKTIRVCKGCNGKCALHKTVKNCISYCFSTVVNENRDFVCRSLLMISNYINRLCLKLGI